MSTVGVCGDGGKGRALCGSLRGSRSVSSVCVCVWDTLSAPQLADPASIYLKTTLSLTGIPEGSKYMVSKAWT